MPSWSDGYVTDIQYTSGFYREMTPAFLSFACAAAGIRAPRLDKGFTYCELGCGQGLGTLLMAAANPAGTFYGVDFNPAQIATAQDLAAAAGLNNVHFIEASFEQLDANAETLLPACDVFSFHGIISWIRNVHYQHIISIVEKRLRPGGLVYVSYNIFPGWAAMAPLQRLMREHATRHPDRSDMQVRHALEFAQRLKEAGAAYFVANPSVDARMKNFANQSATYLAHEYLDETWTPFYFADVTRELERAKLEFACSACLPDNYPDLAVPANVLPILQETHDPVLAETIKDYAINQQFRRDVFVRGRNRLSPVDQTAVMGSMRLCLIGPMPEFPLKIKTSLGEGTADEALYRPILEALAAKPHSIAELLQLPALQGKSQAFILQACAILVHAGTAHPATNLPAKAMGHALSLNQAIVHRALYGQQDYAFLCAPAVGTAIHSDFLGMACLVSLGSLPGKPNVQSLSQAVWQVLKRCGRRLVKAGATLQSKEENMAEIEPAVTSFLAQKYSFWKSLGVF